MKKKTIVNWGEDGMPFKSCFGVIQGGVLSPQLFNEFLSDLRPSWTLNAELSLTKSYFFLNFIICR